MKGRRDTRLSIGLILLLLVLTILAAWMSAREESLPALSSRSSAADGARALWYWLDEMGYLLSSTVSSTFAIPPDTGVVFILEPLAWPGISEDEWEILDAWVEDGGVLLLAGGNLSTGLAASRFDLETDFILRSEVELAPGGPLFPSLPLSEKLPAAPQAAFRLRGEDVLPLMVTEEGPVAVDITRGDGHVLLISDSRLFSNAGLKQPMTGELALNLLARIPAGSRIWFDEWHHGERASTSGAQGPEQWLLQTPAGRAILLVALIIFVWLALSGQRFGRPVPLAQDQARRVPLEYVTAMANLNRRAGHRQALMQHYHSQLKRHLGRRYRLDVHLPDGEYVALLAHFNPRLDAPALLHLLQRLDRRSFSETELVHLARESAGWMQDGSS